jgi:hypothetical protein
MSDLRGRATFTVPIAAASLGRRLYLTVAARTLRASTHVTASVVLSGTPA